MSVRCRPLPYRRLPMRRLLLAATLAVACSTPDGTATIGASGGDVTLQNKVTLRVPPGALALSQEISIQLQADFPPASITPLSNVFKFEPDGLVFAKPVAVEFAHNAGKAPVLYWTDEHGDFKPVASTEK